MLTIGEPHRDWLAIDNPVCSLDSGQRTIDKILPQRHMAALQILIIRFTHPAMMTRYGCGAVRAQA